MAYQSEAALEQQFIEQLNKQEYSTVDIPDYDALVENFKVQFEAFNAPKLDTPITDKEWERIFNLMLGKSVFQSAKILRDKFVLEREDGTKVYLSFFDQDHTKNLIQKLNVLDAVIGLPANLFFGTGIPVCVLVLKRERNGNSDNILFIDASNDFEAGKNQNILRECDIDKIVETYEHRVDVDKYAHVATMQEIEENGFNLNIPRYVDTFEPEEEIDLNAVAAEIRNIQAEIKGIDAQLKPFFDELGLDFPFDVEGK